MKTKILAVVAVLMSAMVAMAQLPAQAPSQPTQKVRSGSLEFYPDFKSQYITSRNVTARCSLMPQPPGTSKNGRLMK